MRIVSLSPATTEILFALKAQSQIVGNTYLCDYPLEAKKIPKIGSFSNMNLEKIKQIEPDLILTSTVVQKRIDSELVKLGFKTLFTDPRSLTDILNSIKIIGRFVNRKKESLDLVAKMEEKIVYFKKNLPVKKPRVYIEEWYQPPMYSGNWVPDIVDLAGGTYGLAEKGGMSCETPEVKLINFNPEFIFVSYCGFGKKSDPDKIMNRKTWQNVKAVKNKKVFAIDETILNRPGPRILQAVNEIKKIIS